MVHGKYGDMVWNHGIPEEYARKYGMPFEDAKRLIRAQYEEVGEANIEWYHIELWLRKFDLPVSAKTLLDRYESYIELFPDTIGGPSRPLWKHIPLLLPQMPPESLSIKSFPTQTLPPISPISFQQPRTTAW
ncbi:MAG: hypothetical protein MZV70_09385 [Desulfobacterales bacterium]|nr:hypothetical protein [Desulfobacterales bacterium]